MTFDQELVQIIPDLRLFARSRVSNQSDADDLVQKTLLRAVEKKQKFGGGKLIAWTITIMKNIKIDESRRMAGVELVEIGENDGSKSPSSQEQSVEVSEVNDAMRELGENCREILVLAGGGYSYQEISNTLLVNKGTVMSRLSRCREQLLEKIA
jgi:RNA polymerase sigma-70 factor (ECF subfamily)